MVLIIGSLLQPPSEKKLPPVIVMQPVKLLLNEATVTATVYRACANECNRDFLITASGFKLDSTNQYKHRVIAVSRDLLKRFNYGDSVYIRGTGKYDGWWWVEDTMNRRWENRIDFLINKDMGLGKWDSVNIFK